MRAYAYDGQLVVHSLRSCARALVRIQMKDACVRVYGCAYEDVCVHGRRGKGGRMDRKGVHWAGLRVSGADRRRDLGRLWWGEG